MKDMQKSNGQRVQSMFCTRKVDTFVASVLSANARAHVGQKKIVHIILSIS